MSGFRIFNDGGMLTEKNILHFVSIKYQELVLQNISTNKHQANKQLNASQRQLLTEPTILSEWSDAVLSYLLIFLSIN
jgi:hypothetical protein